MASSDGEKKWLQCVLTDLKFTFVVSAHVGYPGYRITEGSTDCLHTVVIVNL